MTREELYQDDAGFGEKVWRRPATRREGWRQLLPRCSQPGCRNSSGWSAMLHRATGYWLNDQDWFCGPHCLAASLEEHLAGSALRQRGPAPVRTTMPMGLMMLSRGVISDVELRQAIELQRTTGERMGACLQRLAAVGDEEIASVVATQWGCPLFPAASVQPGCARLVPASLLELYRMLPVHLAGGGRRLFVGFCDGVNHTALLAIEQMLGLETEACIVPEPRLLQGIEQRKQETAGEVAVGRPRAAPEGARMILSYAQQTGADSLRLREVEGNLWVRFFASRSHLDLVFVAGAR